MGPDVSDRPEATSGGRSRAELDASEAGYLELIENLADGVVAVDVDGSILFVNRAACALFERSADELVGEHFGLPLVVGESAQVEVLGGRAQPVFAELRVVHATWRRREARLISLRDVTERVCAHRHVQHVNRVLRSIRNVNQLIVHERQPDRLGAKACELLVETRGYDGAWIATRPDGLELSGCEDELLVTEHGWGSSFAPIRALVEGGGRPPCWERAAAVADDVVVIDPASECPGCPLSRSGAYHGSRAACAVLRSGDASYGVLSVRIPADVGVTDEESSLLAEVAGDLAFALHDISLQRRHHESEARYRSFVDNAPHGVFLTDVSGRYLEVNRAACEVSGRTEAELLTMSIPDLLAEHSLDAGRAHFARLLETGRSSGEVTFAVPGVGDRPVWIDAVRLSDERFLGFVVDISQLQDQREQIESLEQQLVQTRKLEAIGRLAGGVAHDFNNMLSVILGYGDVLINRLRPADPLHKAAKRIVEAGQRSAALTRQLLAFSRRQTLQPKILDLNETLSNLESMLRRLIGEDIELTADLADEIGLVEVDPGQIEQVIVNLVVNARDAMDNGGTLAIATVPVNLDQYDMVEPELQPGPYVRLTVSDTGTGMNDATLAHVFEPFFTTKEKGTGLGLATAYGIVTQSGGQIQIDSAPGCGTTFVIDLPRVDGVSESVDVADQAAPAEGRGESILLVEDEDVLRELCVEVLDELGYRVTSAANGGEALLLVEEQGLRPDLLVTDVVMPGMSGRTVVDRLHKIMPDLPVLYMSGYTDETIAKHGVLEAGAPLLQKPFTLHGFAEKIATLLR